MRLIAEGAPLCISVTELNAIVVARSTFNSSMNYRSVVIFGRAAEVTGEDKARALEVVSDGFLPGRSTEVRTSTKKELAATVVLSVPLDEASLKVREHGVEDEPEDIGTGVWAGLIPLTRVAGEPIADDDESRQLPVPESVRAFIANPKA
jgi:nitroimidazol reductase NimA-like FMN-containing flavoprotein (pyridoxamine 5'-phosphate oxidase superfamily)